MTKYIDACIEVLERLNLSGDTSLMDEELQNDVIESFVRTGYLNIVKLNARPVIVYKDEKKSLYMFADSFKELNDEEIKQLNSDIAV